ncbi:protein kinase domain-containing protein [Gemmatimonas groenlandica]|uniref:non-specific serine/threonine protein kinase n=1 Tax=Gemmatimonas groenlandica TaxID=2732249 RepID=A0A6M4ITC4_9BACT|nr:protein kinase [Gemmatimonas groenlandica]QJR37910.1 protein kinase [Gemmatimonas groenlandica]
MSDVLNRLTTALADRYRVDRELGAGGMATVYLAHDLKHERDVAIKVLHPDLGAALGAERFLSEIKTTAKLQHPHILPLLDSGAADGLLYYVMPYVRGETLRARLDRERQLPLDDALLIAREVADALGAAHELGIVHRDIKPENILLQGGHALVADFGIALAVQSAGGARMTQTGLSLGTPQYMSPEQAMGERAIDARTDIYALGAVTYEMLTGDAPFTGSSLQAIVAKVLTERPTSMLTVRDTIAPHVERAVMDALAKLPADRPPSARAFADRLRTASADPTESDTTTNRSEQTAHPRDRRFGFGALAVAAGVTALLTLAPWPWTRPSTVPPVSPLAARFTILGPPATAVVGQQDAVTPDGRVVVFAARGADSVRRLYARELTDITPRLIEGTERARDMAISPSGEWLAFLRDNELYKTRLAGGSPVLLSRFATSQGSGLAWADSLRIVLSFDGRIAVVSANGGTPELVAVPDTVAKWSLILPHVLEDGKTMLAVHWNGTAAISSIVSMDLTNGQTTDLGVAGTMPLGVVDQHLVYCAPDGSLAVAPYAPTGASASTRPVQLLADVRVSSNRCTVAISRTGVMVSRTRTVSSNLMLGDERDAKEVLRADKSAIAAARFSPDLGLIAYHVTTTDGSTSIQIYDRSLNTSRRLNTPEGDVVFLGWTPDGKRVLFRHLSASTPNGEVWWQSVDGGPAETLLTVAGQRIVDAALTPDGRHLVYQMRSAATSQLLVREFKSRASPRPLAHSAARDEAPSISPNGQWVAFVSDESGAREVYVVPLAGGSRSRISLTGGIEPLWSRDGRVLYYRSGNVLIAARFANDAALALSSRDTVMRRSIVSYGSRANYDVAPDGRILFVESRNLYEGELVVELDWFARLRGLVAGDEGKRE